MTGVCQPPSLVLCGNEVANPARTLSYHQAGLSPRLQVSGALDPTAYQMTPGLPGVYNSPAGDPAPWYDPLLPSSADFLGFYASDVTGYDASHVTRDTDERGGFLGGASFQAENSGGRVHKWTGLLLAATPAGLQYGKRWLESQLGAICESCATCDSAVRVMSPGTGTWEDGRYLEYEVATTAGPVYKDLDEYACQVEFTLVAGNPYLYKEPINVVAAEPLVSLATGTSCMPFDQWLCGTAEGIDICLTVPVPNIGEYAPIVYLDGRGGGATGVHLLMYDDCPDGSPSGTARGVTVNQLLDGWQLVIDSAKGIITSIDPAGGLHNGANLVESTDHGDPFVVVASCDTQRCLCVGVDHPCNSGDNTLVSMDTQWRLR